MADKTEKHLHQQRRKPVLHNALGWARTFVLPVLLSVSFTSSFAQELFPIAEPASTLPKKTLGVRFYSENYKELHNQYRDFSALRLMYGITSKLSCYVTASVSNHHSKDLPPDFPDHNTPQIGVKLPFLFNGVNFYLKYRLYSRDQENSHLRVAAFAEYGWLNVAHDEAEPDIIEDTKGFGSGLICTYLKHRFAVSLTGGYLFPSKYDGVVPDPFPGLPGVPAHLVYGKAITSSLSFGYLLLPKTYESYEQMNLNLYLEFIGKAYDAMQIYLENIALPGSTYQVKRSDLPALSAGRYVEAHPGIQAIIKSKYRVDLSVGFPLINKSYVHFYPLYMVGVQRYIYL